MKKVFKEKGIIISPAQIGILFLLLKNNSQSMSDLSTALEIDNSSITRLVDNLERLNFVKRELNPGDRRQFFISLTGEGRKEINRTKKVVREINGKMKEGIPENELGVFFKVINQMCMNLGK